MSTFLSAWSSAIIGCNHIPTLESYLDDAVMSEQYELASLIRDRIKEVLLKDIDTPDIKTIDPPY